MRQTPALTAEPTFTHARALAASSPAGTRNGSIRKSFGGSHPLLPPLVPASRFLPPVRFADRRLPNGVRQTGFQQNARKSLLSKHNSCSATLEVIAWDLAAALHVGDLAEDRDGLRFVHASR